MVPNKKTPAGPWLVHKKLHIPIYGATLYLVVTEDIPKAYRRLKPFTPDPDGIGNGAAKCVSNNTGSFALLFMPYALDINTMGHEVFHLTNFIMQWAGVPFTWDEHEPAAWLHGYLVELVCGELVKVKDKK